MNKLIVQPLNQSSISTVIVIDALDECEDDEPASAILSVLGRLISEIPKVKFFLTGRPERHIRGGFRLPLLVNVADVFVLHEVDPCQVRSDVRLFFRHNFSKLAGRRGLDDWPTEQQLDVLCDRAAGLFVYAAATVKFIDNQNNNPRRRLDLLLQSPENSAREGKAKLKNTTLDSLYSSILHRLSAMTIPRTILGSVLSLVLWSWLRNPFLHLPLPCSWVAISKMCSHSCHRFTPSSLPPHPPGGCRSPCSTIP